MRTRRFLVIVSLVFHFRLVVPDVLGQNESGVSRSFLAGVFNSVYLINHEPVAQNQNSEMAHFQNSTPVPIS